jgi:hypothetical protein
LLPSAFFFAVLKLLLAHNGVWGEGEAKSITQLSSRASAPPPAPATRAQTQRREIERLTNNLIARLLLIN